MNIQFTYHPCPTCSGRGYTRKNEYKCEKCCSIYKMTIEQYRWEFVCQSCGGHIWNENEKQITCPDCSGTGRGKDVKSITITDSATISILMQILAAEKENRDD